MACQVNNLFSEFTWQIVWLCAKAEADWGGGGFTNMGQSSIWCSDNLIGKSRCIPLWGLHWSRSFYFSIGKWPPPAFQSYGLHCHTSSSYVYVNHSQNFLDLSIVSLAFLFFFFWNGVSNIWWTSQILRRTQDAKLREVGVRLGGVSVGSSWGRIVDGLNRLCGR